MSSNRIVRPSRPPIRCKLRSNLLIEEDNVLPKSERAHSHIVRRVRKKGKYGGPRDFHYWYYKEFIESAVKTVPSDKKGEKEKKETVMVPANPESAHRIVKICVVIGELMRLMDDHYPKVRPVKRHDKDRYFCGVMSKEIQGLHFYGDDTLIDKIKKDEVKGTGRVVANAMCNNNVDLKLYDLGIDEKETLVAFDNDWCLAHRRKPHRYSRELTVNDFKALPDTAPLPTPNAEAAPADPAKKSEPPRAFQPFNWIDRYHAGERQDKTPIIKALNTPKTKQEIYETFLWRILFSRYFLQKFSECLFRGEDASDVSDELEKMRRILEKETILIPEFRAFLQTPEAIAMKNHLINRMRAFKFLTKFEFKDAFSDMERALRKIQENFETLCSHAEYEDLRAAEPTIPDQKQSTPAVTDSSSSSSSSSSAAAAKQPTSHRTKRRRETETAIDDKETPLLNKPKKTQEKKEATKPLELSNLSLFRSKPTPLTAPSLDILALVAQSEIATPTPLAKPLLPPSSLDRAIDQTIAALPPTPTSNATQHAQPLKIPTVPPMASHSAGLAQVGLYNTQSEVTLDEDDAPNIRTALELK